MPASATISLLDAEPDLAAWLSAEEQELARGLVVPIVGLSRDSWELDEVLDGAGAFAGLVLDGMVMHRMAVAGRQILRLLGPGDLVVHTWTPRSAILGSSSKRAAGPVRLALLDGRLVQAARRFPGLIVGLHLRLGDQHQRLAVQLGICQLPRVQDRVLTLFWLLAESWGRVTTTGTRLPLRLTHAAIGELIGARRPTVSLALRELTAGGALLQQEDGWLLLEQPSTVSPLPPSSDPIMLEDDDSRTVSRAGLTDIVNQAAGLGRNG
jgi:CRP-like cAMP-binding protein